MNKIYSTSGMHEVMETQTEPAHMIYRPRPPEDRETVRRQQKELRRIRQRARRENLTKEQIEQRREKGREYYVQKKSRRIMKKTKQKNVSVHHPRVDQIVQCTAAEQINEQRMCDREYQYQQKGNWEDKLLMKQAEQSIILTDRPRVHCGVLSTEIKIINAHNNRLTQVKREARGLHNQMVSRYENVRHPRLIHIRRQARKLGSRAVDKFQGNGIRFQDRGSIFEKKDPVSLVQEHAKILIDISRMNGYCSTEMKASSGTTRKNGFNKGDHGVYLDNEDRETAANDSEESPSDSEEVLAFLTGLSTIKENIENEQQG